MTIHRSVRALSRGLALIGELNTSGPSSAQQLAAQERAQPHDLLPPAADPAAGRLCDVRRDERPVQPHPAGEAAERRPVDAGPVAAGRPAADVRPARAGVVAQRLRGLRAGLDDDPREHALLQPVLGPSLDGRPGTLPGAQCARPRRAHGRDAGAATRDAGDHRFAGARGCRTRARPPLRQPLRGAHEKRRLRLVGGRDGAGHQRHRHADRRRRPGDRQPQHRVLHLGDDARGRGPALPAEPEAGRPGNRTSLARSAGLVQEPAGATSGVAAHSAARDAPCPVPRSSALRASHSAAASSGSRN